jgi:hypothetical protein
VKEGEGVGREGKGKDGTEGEGVGKERKGKVRRKVKG